MATTFSTYYDLVRTREMGPEAKDWAATDTNFEIISLILKAFEQHAHTGVAGLAMPGGVPTLSEASTGGSLAPGTTVGVRLSYLNAAGLETTATTETDITLAPAVSRPLTPIFTTLTPAANALIGGTYMYVMTKTKGSGETQASDALPVTVTYDQTYSVTITFNAISTYTDGTTGYNIYRASGLGSSFQLVGQITDTSQTSFTDANTAPGQSQQPPTTSTFDTTRYVAINWATLAPYPAGATTLHVYVTRQPGVWGTNALLTTVDLTAPSPPTSFNYLGSESLGTGYPYDSTQIPAAPPKLNLATEATGGFSLTADGNFNQHQAKNLVFDTASTAPSSPVNGQVYYDTSINNIRAYINGSWTVWGMVAGTGYTHPAEEVGGHLASNIRWVAGSASPTVGSLLSELFDSSGNAIGQTATYGYALSNAGSTSSSTITGIPGLVGSIPGHFWGKSYQILIAYLNGNIVISGNAGINCTIYLQVYDSSFTLIGSQGWNIQSPITTLAFAMPISFCIPAAIPTGGGTLQARWAAGSGATLTVTSNALSINSIYLP